MGRLAQPFCISIREFIAMIVVFKTSSVIIYFIHNNNRIHTGHEKPEIQVIFENFLEKVMKKVMKNIFIFLDIFLSIFS